MSPDLIRAYAAKLSSQAGAEVGEAEARLEVAEVARRVARNLARDFAFGYHGEEDMEQQGVLYALQILAAARPDGSPVYDATRPLENFLHVHVKNRLRNFKRDNFMRAARPCDCCEPFGRPADPCEKWRRWHQRNASKQNLMRPLDVASVGEDGGRNAPRHDVLDEVAGREVLDRLDASLPPEVRADYLRMRSGVSVPRARRRKVREAVLVALGGGA